MPLFQNESKCETIQMKMSHEPLSRTHFHMNGFALLQKGTRKWPTDSEGVNPAHVSIQQ